MSDSQTSDTGDGAWTPGASAFAASGLSILTATGVDAAAAALLEGWRHEEE